MECRNFKMTLISANNLSNVRKFGSMKVYARVSLRDADYPTYHTPVDEFGGTNPKWNTCFNYWVNQSSLEKEGGVVADIEFYCERTFGDKYVGQVNLDLKKLFENAETDKVNYTVKTRHGQRTEGKLEFLYTFGDVETVHVKNNKRKSFLEEVDREEEVTLVVDGVFSVLEAIFSN